MSFSQIVTQYQFHFIMICVFTLIPYTTVNNYSWDGRQIQSKQKGLTAYSHDISKHSQQYLRDSKCLWRENSNQCSTSHSPENNGWNVKSRELLAPSSLMNKEASKPLSSSSSKQMEQISSKRCRRLKVVGKGVCVSSVWTSNDGGNVVASSVEAEKGRPLDKPHTPLLL